MERFKEKKRERHTTFICKMRYKMKLAKLESHGVGVV